MTIPLLKENYRQKTTTLAVVTGNTWHEHILFLKCCLPSKIHINFAIQHHPVNSKDSKQFAKFKFFFLMN